MARTITVARLLVPVIADASKFKPTLSAAAKDAEKFSQLVKGAARTATIALGAVTAAATAAAAVLFKLAKSAQPLPGIMRAFHIQSQRSGLSLDALRKAAQGTITDLELMRQSNIALTGVGRELGQAFGRDLPTLLEGARAAARAQGKSVDYMFSSIVSGVKRATPLLIDNTGLVLKLGEVNRKWAAAAGVTVDQMTAQQKSLAILEATTKAVNRMIEETGGLTLTSAERAGRVSVAFQNWGHQIGLTLLPAMDTLNDLLYEMINSIGPRLLDLFQNKIGPGLAALAEIVADFVAEADLAFTKLLEKHGSTLEQMAFKALQWGIEVSVQFATGLVRGATTAIVTAMKFIAGLLTFWMGPGSPPRIAPDVDKWGLETAREFLLGFARADFDLLEGFQSKLAAVLGALVGAGEIAADDSEKLFRNLTLRVGQALDAFRETGRMPIELFERLRESGGRLGNDLAKLARVQFQLAAATDRYRLAEERVKNAQEARDDATDDLTRIMREYNRMLEEGATAEELAAKRAQFLAAKDRLRTAEDEIAAAEKQKDAAEEGLDPLREQLDLQKRLVDQLVKLIGKQEESTEEAEKALKKKLGIPGIGIPDIAKLPPLTIPALDTSAMDKAFEEAKDKIKAALEEAFAPLRKFWEEEVMGEEGAVARITTAWADVTDAFDKFWTHPSVVAVREYLGKAFGLEEIDLAGLVSLATQMLILVGVFKLLGAAVALVSSPLALLVAGLVFIAWAVTTKWEQMGTTIWQMAVIVHWALLEVSKAIQKWAQQLATTAAQLEAIISMFLTLALAQIVVWVGQVGAWFSTLGTVIMDIVGRLRTNLLVRWNLIKAAAIRVWTDLVTAIEGKIDAVKAYIEGKIEDIRTFIDEFDLKEVGKNLIKSLMDGIAAKARALIDKAVGVVSDAIQAAKRLLGMGSPSKVFIDIGHAMSEGMALGISGSRFLPAMATAGMVQNTIDRSVSRVNYNTLNVSTRATTGTYIADFHTAVALAR